MSAPHILIIEDSPEMQMLIAGALDNLGLLDSVNSASEALVALAKKTYSLILLDVELPGENGFNFLAKLRLDPRHKNVCVFMLTGRGQTSDKVLGFSLGADDYLVKPIDFVELRARVGSKLKKLAEESSAETWLKKGPFSLDLERCRFYILDGQESVEVELTIQEFKLFAFLMRREDRVLSRSQILDEVWSVAQVTDRTVDTHVYSLRKKLGKWSNCILSVPGIGYRFVSKRAE